MPKSTQEASYIKRSITLSLPIDRAIEQLADEMGETYSVAIREIIRRGINRPIDTLTDNPSISIPPAILDRLTNIAERLHLPPESLLARIVEEGLFAWLKRAEDLENRRSQIAPVPSSPPP